MKYLVLTAILMSFSAVAFGQVGGLRLTSDSAELQRSSEYNAKNISITSESGQKVFKSLRDLDSDLAKAIDLYNAGKYDEAFPVLAELSQWGVKRAQMLLGGMYMSGFHVDQSTERAMAWLGVAKEVKSERQATRMFKHVYKQLNQDQKVQIDKIVDSYIAKYGVDAQNFKCRKRKPIGSNIPVTECSKLPNSNSILYPIS
ncbi:MAG: hypothetical protein MK188_15255 [Gammaproteobacteria bacterium]|nr:hypothetical protein [Gammaproteobacteria bacterium]